MDGDCAKNKTKQNLNNFGAGNQFQTIYCSLFVNLKTQLKPILKPFQDFSNWRFLTGPDFRETDGHSSFSLSPQHSQITNH